MVAKMLTEAILRCGAAKAAVIGQDQIVSSEEFRRVCESNQCGGYGRCWMCPPDIGEITVLMNQVRSYPWAVLYQSVGRLEDSYDIEGMLEAAHRHALLSQKIHSTIKPLLAKPFLHLSCGGCHLCEVCAKVADEPCCQPGKALSSLEGCGIDVYNTTKNTKLKYVNGQNTVTYFGMVLFTE